MYNDFIKISVVEKMSAKVDVFFYGKLLKSILNPLMLIVGRQNFMEI